MILQAYDFLELNRRYGCRVQFGGLRPVGQHRQRDRPDAPRTRPRDLRDDHAASDHLGRQEDGQDRLGRDLAERRDAERLRVLAVLAQHDGCRRGPVPQALHRIAGGRNATRRRRAWRGSEINEAKIVLANEAGTALCHWPRGGRGRRPRPPRARSSSRGGPARPRTCRRCPAQRRPEVGEGHFRGASLIHPLGPRGNRARRSKCASSRIGRARA